MKDRSLSSVLRLAGIEHLCEKKVMGYAVDSRKVKEGFLFFALKGEKVDGHDFLQDVKEKGAVAAIVKADYEPKVKGLELIFVDDVLATMQQMARSYLQFYQGKIVAVTGSVGKTTTKEFIATLLSSQYRVFKTPGNANSQIGLPLSLLNEVTGLEDVLVLEMGMTGPSHIRNLVSIAPPDVSIITKVVPAHVEYFSDGLQGVAQAKAEILEHPKTEHAFINSNASVYREVREKGVCSKTYFSLYQDPYPYLDCWMEKRGSQWVIKSLTKESPEIELPFEADHLCENFLGAALIARYFLVGWDKIVSYAKVLQTEKMRFEKIERDGILFINDCYNANPVSMKAALSNLPKPKEGGKTIAVLGHMVELGPESPSFHKEVGEYAATRVDKLLCVGELTYPYMQAFKEKGKPAEHFTDLTSMKKGMDAQVKPGDVVLIKGSNSVQLWRLLENEK